MRPRLSLAEIRGLQRDADRVALRIIRVCRIPNPEREDLRQELLVDLVRRLPKFDETRGSLGAFAATCLTHHAKRLIKRILRGRAAIALSLDDPLPGGDGLTFADALAEEDGYGAWIGQATDSVAALANRLDLDRAISSLPVQQQRYCAAIASRDRSAPSHDAHSSRSTAFRRAREIRLKLLARGIGPDA